MDAGPHPTYAHSGKLGAGLLAVPAVGIVVALALGPAYAYATVYSPVVGLSSIVLVVVYACGVGGALAFTSKAAKVRNQGFMWLVGACVGLLAVYTAWACFESALLAKGQDDTSRLPGYTDLLLNPAAVWDVAGVINDTGWFTIKSATPKGWWLLALWVVEAGCIVAGVAVVGASLVSGAVFCESCDQWCHDHVGGDMHLAIPEDGDLLARVAAGDLAALEQLDPHRGELTCLLARIKTCAGCTDTTSLQLLLRKETLDDEGKPQVSTEELSPIYLVGADGLDRLETLAERIYAPGGSAREDGGPSEAVG